MELKQNEVIKDKYQGLTTAAQFAVKNGLKKRMVYKWLDSEIEKRKRQQDEKNK